MKKFMIVITSLLMLAALTGCGCQKKAKTEDTSGLTEIEKQVQNGTEEVQGDFKVTDIKIEESGAESIVSGKVTNNSKNAKSITITLMMTNSDTAQLLGIVDVNVDNLASSETKDFSLSIVGDYSQVNNFEVRITEK